MKGKILKEFLPIVKNYFPYITNEEVKFLDHGHDHYVLLIHNLHAFRFPRSSGNGLQDDVINIFSQKFAALSPAPIQKMTGHFDEESRVKYQTYDFLQGVGLSKEMAGKLSEAELLDIAKRLGKFSQYFIPFRLKMRMK